MLRLLKELVEIESYSRDKAGVDRLADFVAGEFAARGAVPEVLTETESGNGLLATWRSGSAGNPVLVLGHLDTVWPLGTLASRPFRVEDGKAWGPGVFDMKAGILLTLLLCEALQRGACVPGKDVLFLFTPDEEVGTAAGLPHLRRIAAGCRAVLCLEPPLPGGRAKTFRKGVGTFHLAVRGVSAHAGVDHERGANAVVELCRQAIRLQEMTDYARGRTLSVGALRGGGASNVVPDQAEADVDFRVSTVADGEAVEESVRALRPFDSRCTLEVRGGLNRPPLERTPGVVALYETASAAAQRIGMPFGEGSTGGGSDGSITAAMGIPTLDGLGVAGAGAHALHEHILIEDIPKRLALLSELVRDIQ